MQGPLPKDPATRQRRNKVSTRATLSLVADGPMKRPPLPKRGEGRKWHRMTLQFWKAIWASPMAAEYLEADVQSLYRLAVLIDMFWEKPTLGAAAEIYRQQQAFGLTPIDRRRLQWIVEKAEGSKRGRPSHSGPMDPADDPRRMLSVVS